MKIRYFINLYNLGKCNKEQYIFTLLCVSKKNTT